MLDFAATAWLDSAFAHVAARRGLPEPGQHAGPRRPSPGHGGRVPGFHGGRRQVPARSGPASGARHGSSRTCPTTCSSWSICARASPARSRLRMHARSSSLPPAARRAEPAPCFGRSRDRGGRLCNRGSVEIHERASVGEFALAGRRRATSPRSRRIRCSRCGSQSDTPRAMPSGHSSPASTASAAPGACADRFAPDRRRGPGMRSRPPVQPWGRARGRLVLRSTDSISRGNARDAFGAPSISHRTGPRGRGTSTSTPRSRARWSGCPRNAADGLPPRREGNRDDLEASVRVEGLNLGARRASSRSRLPCAPATRSRSRSGRRTSGSGRPGERGLPLTIDLLKRLPWHDGSLSGQVDVDSLPAALPDRRQRGTQSVPAGDPRRVRACAMPGCCSGDGTAARSPAHGRRRVPEIEELREDRFGLDAIWIGPARHAAALGLFEIRTTLKHSRQALPHGGVAALGR